MTDQEMMRRLVDHRRKRPELFDEYATEFVTSNASREFLPSDKSKNYAYGLLSKVENDPRKEAFDRKEVWAQAKACGMCLEGKVILRKAFGDGERSAKIKHDKVPREQQFREAAFACSCAKGKLVETWQKFRPALDGWQEGWRTPDRFAESLPAIVLTPPQILAEQLIQLMESKEVADGSSSSEGATDSDARRSSSGFTQGIDEAALVVAPPTTTAVLPSSPDSTDESDEST